MSPATSTPEQTFVATTSCSGRRALLAVIVGIALSGIATAQERPGGGYSLPPVPPASPAGEHVFNLKAVSFEGNRTIETPELEAIAAPFLNRNLRLAEIEELRQRITRHYVERGHVNSGAIIPAEAFRDGVLHIRIVEGRVTEVRLHGMDGLADDYLVSRLGTDDTLNVNILQERIRLLLADPLFERINARLIPGTSLGSAIAEVDVTRAPAFHAQVFANNTLAPSLGEGLVGINGFVRNLTGWGDVLEATVQSSGHTDHYDLSWSLPLRASRTTLDLRFAHGASIVVEEPFDLLDIRSVTDTRQIGLGHPVVSDTRRQLALGIIYGERSTRTTLDGEPFSFTPGEKTGKTTVRDWSIYQDYVQRFERHVLALRSTFLWGRNNLARDALPGQPPRRYRMWVGQFQWLARLGDTGTQLVVRGNLQYTPDRLVPLERLGIGGRHTVRGYRENQLVRDNGCIANVELVHPLLNDQEGRRHLNIVPFIDLGSGRNHGETHDRLASTGIGFQGRWGGFDGEIYFARRLKTPATEAHGSLQDRGIHLQVRYAFM